MLASSIGRLAWTDYSIIVGYFVVMLGIGAYFYRLMRRMRDFFTGGNAIPWWLAAASHYMSSFSVFAFVANTTLVYLYGWVGITLFWCQIPGTILCTLVFAPRWRRARIDSPIEYLEARYNPAIRQLCAWHGIPFKIIDDALKLVAIGLFFSGGLGLDLKQSMLWSGLIMLAYTFMGGLWAVVVTDFVQFVVMGAAVLVLFVLSLVRTGGAGALVANAPEGAFRLVSGEYGWAYVAAMVFLYVISMSSVHWGLIQKFCCVPTERDVRKMGWTIAVLQLITPVLMFLPGLAARQFLGPDQDAGQIYPIVCAELLPAGLLGLMIAAMFSATMSMLSSDYNACASVLTNDVYRRMIRPQASERELVLVGRLMTLLVGALALVIAFSMVGEGAGGEKLFRNMVKLFSVATAPVAVPMILGLIVRRLSGASAVAGLLTGLAVGLIGFRRLGDEVALAGTLVKKENLLLVATAVTSAVTMIVASLLLPQKAAEQSKVSAFFARLAAPVGMLPGDIEVGSASARQAAGPFRVVGICTILIGALMVAIAPFVPPRLGFWLDLLLGVAMVVGGGAAMLLARRALAATDERAAPPAAMATSAAVPSEVRG
jgi:SSS family transporter